MADLRVNKHYVVNKMKPEVALLWMSRQIEELKLTIKAAKQDLIKFESDIEQMRTNLEHMEKVQKLDKQIHIQRLEADLEHLIEESKKQPKQIEGETITIKGGESNG